MRAVWLASLFTFSLTNSFPVLNINGNKDDTEDENRSLRSILRDLPEVYFEDAYISVDNLIRKKGYPVEVHRVRTQDSYILTIHRIPFGRINSNETSNNRPVIFLQHGILGSSSDWVVAGPGRGLGYILADAGFDVWMGNVRGNRYSKKHTCFDPYKHAPIYWDFSWHEIGYYDLPAMIDYILQKTQKKDLYYAGHSQGTTAFFVMTSTRPEYNKKIRAQFSMAPVAYVGNVFSPLVRILSYIKIPLHWISKMIGIYEFLPNNDLLSNLAEQWCDDDSITQFLCRNAIFALTGFNKEQTNSTLLPVILGHTPAGSSVKQFLHFGQLVSSGQFRRFDYGFLGNLKKYGSLRPPSYDLSKVTVPVYLFYSRNDWMAAEQDVLTLEANLGNARGRFLNPDPNWNHMDHVYGIDAWDYVYNKIISLISRHRD